MIVETKMCYTQLIVLTQLKSYCDAVRKTTFTKPEVEFEGMAGFIEVKATFEVSDLALFSTLYDLACSGEAKIYDLRQNIRYNVLRGIVCA